MPPKCIQQNNRANRNEKRRGNKTGIYFCSECSNCAEQNIDEHAIETEASAGMFT